MEGAMAEVLLNRNVPLIDEVAELIEQGGGPSLTSILDALRPRDRGTPPNKLPSGARSSITGFNTRSRRRRLLGGVRSRAPDLLLR
jgi:hypothetical protein